MASPALKLNWVESCSWPWRTRTQPFWETITVTGSSITFVSATARLSSWIKVRRSSPKSFISDSISFTMRLRSVVSLWSKPSRSSRSALSSLSSCSILMPSRRANWRKRISNMSSAWRSESLNSLIRSTFGSSLLRMILMTLSIFRRTVKRPSKICMRSLTLPKRCCVRRVTVATLNSTHSVRISLRPFWRGRPSLPIITKFIGALDSKEVWASSRLTNSLTSIFLLLGSNTKRTAASLLDSSRTPSKTFKMVDLRLFCSGVRVFFPTFTFGLVISSISCNTRWEEVAGGNSLTTICHWPRANSSTDQRARTLILPRPVS